jgi:hypothetical protein
MEWPDWAALAAFALVIAVGAMMHEPWRDELDPWLRVRDSHSIADLRAALSHTGHPVLWYALLGLIRPIGVHAIPFLHALIAVGYAYVLLRFAPFPRWLRVALLFGYYLVFEYAVITRCYGLGTLGLFAFCALFPERRERLAAICVVLAIMVHASIHAMAMAAACSLALLIALPERRTVMALGAVAGSALLAVWAMLPSRDNVWMQETFTRALVGWELLSVRLLDALVPIPASPPQWWNQGRLGFALGGFRSLLVLVALAGAIVWSLRRARPAWVLFVSGTTALVLIFGFVYFGYARHHGHVFLLGIGACWIAWDLDAPGRRARSYGLAALAAVHVFAAIWCLLCDARQPFSNAVHAARRVRELRLPAGTAIIGEHDSAASALTAFLPGTLYYPAGEREGTYVQFDHAEHVSDAKVLGEAARLRQKTGQPPLLVLNRALPENTAGVRLIASFTGAAVGDENFWIYATE